MEAKDINVTSTEEFSIYRQTIIPASQDSVPEELAVIHREWLKKKASGELKVKFIQGGVRSIVTTEEIKTNGHLTK